MVEWFPCLSDPRRYVVIGNCPRLGLPSQTGPGRWSRLREIQSTHMVKVGEKRVRMPGGWTFMHTQTENVVCDAACMGCASVCLTLGGWNWLLGSWCIGRERNSLWIDQIRGLMCLNQLQPNKDYIWSSDTHQFSCSVLSSTRELKTSTASTAAWETIIFSILSQYKSSLGEASFYDTTTLMKMINYCCV